MSDRTNSTKFDSDNFVRLFHQLPSAAERRFLVFIYMSYAITCLCVGIYGCHKNRLVGVMQKQGKATLVMRKGLLSAILGGFIWMQPMITYGAIYAKLLSGNLRKTMETGAIVSSILVMGCLGYSIFVFTMLVIKALVLAKDGIVGTRKKWLVSIENYLGNSIITCAAILIPIHVAVLPGALDYFSAVCVALFLILYCTLTVKLKTIAEKATTHQDVAAKCRQFCLATIAITVALIIFVGYLVTDFVNIAMNRRANNLVTAVFPIAIIMKLFVILKFNATITKGDQDTMQAQTPQNHGIDTITNHEINYMPHLLKTTDIPIMNADLAVIGQAPLPLRPLWLSTNGVGQSNVEAGNWSISLVNFVRFMHACMATDTWVCLAHFKEGEDNINMYDMKSHFINPWTSGTGCSVAGLMEPNQGSVELMISHAWTGSVKETVSAIESTLSLYNLPKDTCIFFDSLCLYQPDDGAPLGLSIAEQLVKKPFALIIKSMPRHGMFVIHTSTSEIYDRLWCVHEMDECLVAEVKMFGVFDLAKWDKDKLKRISKNANTRNAQCQGKDKIMLTNLINSRGGFDRLDNEIKDVRRQSIRDYATTSLFEQLFGMSIAITEQVDTCEA